MHPVHILTSIKIAWLCQTSGFQWKASQGAPIISLPDPIPPFFGSLHTYSGALKAVPTQKPLLPFFPIFFFIFYFLHPISEIIHANSTIAPSSLHSTFYLETIWKYQFTDSWFSLRCSLPALCPTSTVQITCKWLYMLCCVLKIQQVKGDTYSNEIFSVTVAAWL